MKTQPHTSSPSAANRPRGPLTAWSALALALAVASPKATHAYDLKQLLEQPLERLLTLEITSRRVATFAEPQSHLPSDRADGGDHAP